MTITKSKQTKPANSEKTTLDDAMVNDSLGTINISDSTGSDPEKETGDARRKIKETGRQD